MLKLVVTVILSGPRRDIATANMHASASAMIVGPEITPPGRSIDGLNGRRSTALP